MWRRWLLIIGLSLVVGYLSSAVITFVTADLGRHLTNGRIFWQTGQIPQGNYYSYTFPEMSFVNHHWLSGVIFYAVFWLSGFGGLSWLFIGISALTFGVLFHEVIKKTDWWMAAAVAVGFLPLLISRTEIRPEIFSYLLIAVFVVILQRYYQGRVTAKWLCGLVLLQIAWVNLHIYFIIGVGLVGLFLAGVLMAGFFRQLSRREVFLKTKVLSLLLLGVGLASLVNPMGWLGAIRPFQIYDNYGYRVLEEQSVNFLQQVYPVPTLSYFYFGLGLIIASWVWIGWRVWKKQLTWQWPEFLLTIVFVGLGWRMMRNFSLFGLMGMYLVGLSLAGIKMTSWTKERLWTVRIGLIVGMALVVLMLNGAFWQNRAASGIGLAEGVDGAAKFFSQNHIKGPIFNNYDIGGYLIFYLFPQERVFVDNRPDAYPASFFEQTYIPMQEQAAKWQAVDSQYHFNSIFFYRLDLTPWAQQFLIARVRDPEWAPVFVDDRTIILVRRNDQNAELIKQSEIPQAAFGGG